MPVWMVTLVVAVGYLAGVTVTLPIGVKVGWNNVKRGVDTDGRSRCDPDRPNTQDDWPELLILPAIWPIALPIALIIIGSMRYGRYLIDRQKPEEIRRRQMPDLREAERRGG